MGLDARKPVYSGVCQQQRCRQQSDQRLRYLLIKKYHISRLDTSEISIFYLVSVAEQTGLNLILSETPKTGFVASRPIIHPYVVFFFYYPVILFCHLYRLIWESFPTKKWPLFSQFHVFWHLFSQFLCDIFSQM